jgi:hypothetical protein
MRRQLPELADWLRRLLTTCEQLIRRQKHAVAEHRFAAGLLLFHGRGWGNNAELGCRRLDEHGQSLLLEIINADSWHCELAPFSGPGSAGPSTCKPQRPIASACA